MCFLSAMKLTFGSILVSVLLSACNYNKDRDVILLNDTINDVQDSIAAMNGLLAEAITNDGPNYFYDDSDQLYVCNQKVSSIHHGVAKENIDSSSALSSFSKEQKMQFLSIAHFLKKNFITSCYKDFTTGVYKYGYREVLVKEYNNTRYLIYSENQLPDLSIPNLQKVIILDQKGHLYLLRYKSLR
jgi:hypothetical protein